MPGTIVRMDRSPVVIDGTNKYQIIATCDVKGTLPDTGIFLLKIQTATDPRDDVLTRVIAVADTTTFPLGRDTAIANGITQWRSSTVLLTYDDIEVANAAWKELSARINTLVDNVDTLLNEFQTGVTNETITYPTASDAAVDAAINAYLSTRNAVTSAETARNAEQEECNDLKKDIDNINLRITDATGDLDRYTQVNAQLGAYYSSLSLIKPAITTATGVIRTLNATSLATLTEQANIEAQLRVQDSQTNAFGAVNAGLSTLLGGPVASAVTILNTRLATLTAERTSLIAQYNACASRTAALQVTLDAARSTRDAALASVRAICPDYAPPTN